MLRPLHGIFGATCFAFLALSLPSTAQNAPEPENISVQTPDGLRLSGKWFQGGKGKNSDCVLLVHNYGVANHSGKGDWEALALALQKEGHSVLMFDMRGHGKNKDSTRSVDDGEKFASYKFNIYANAGKLDPKNPPKSLNAQRFSPAYYPFLVNDLAGARRFLDQRNDAGECNSGRIFVIADRESAPLTMLWAGIEFDRNGIFPAVPGADAPRHNAGSDLMGIIFLSHRPSTIFTLPYDQLIRDRPIIHTSLRDKVSFLFIDNEKVATKYASGWWQRWGISLNTKEDKEKAKFIYPVPKSESLIGIDLLAVNKHLGVTEVIAKFLESTKKKNINGHDWKMRNAGAAEIIAVPLDRYGVRVPF